MWPSLVDLLDPVDGRPVPLTDHLGPGELLHQHLATGTAPAPGAVDAPVPLMALQGAVPGLKIGEGLSTEPCLAFLQPLHFVVASPATSTEQPQHSREEDSFQGAAKILARGQYRDVSLKKKVSFLTSSKRGGGAFCFTGVNV